MFHSKSTISSITQKDKLKPWNTKIKEKISMKITVRGFWNLPTFPIHRDGRWTSSQLMDAKSQGVGTKALEIVNKEKCYIWLLQPIPASRLKTKRWKWGENQTKWLILLIWIHSFAEEEQPSTQKYQRSKTKLLKWQRENTQGEWNPMNLILVVQMKVQCHSFKGPLRSSSVEFRNKRIQYFKKNLEKSAWLECQTVVVNTCRWRKKSIRRKNDKKLQFINSDIW